MKKLIPALLLIFFLGSCASNQVVLNSIMTQPRFALKPQPIKILVVNTYDVEKADYRDNKHLLFTQLIDNVKNVLANELRLHSNVETVILPGLYNNSKDSLSALLTQHKATQVFSIDFLDAYFNQTNVVVTRNSNGAVTNRQAYYDIVSKINFTVHNSEGYTMYFPMTYNKFHSSRPVISGLLAVGPNIVTNKASADEASTANLFFFLKNFFPYPESRYRTLFTTKQFKDLRTAMRADNYDSAISLCMRIAQTPKKNVAAKAFYNCAVLCERLKSSDSVRMYLRKSLDANYTGYASMMLMDYP